MPKPISEQKREEVRIYYAQTQNYRETARHFGISDTAVRRICKESPQLLREIEEKNAQAHIDALEWLSQQGTRFASILDKLVGELQNEEKIRDASLRECATVFGIVCDKLTDLKATQMQSGKIAEEDPLTKALNEGLGDGIK